MLPLLPDLEGRSFLSQSGYMSVTNWMLRLKTRVDTLILVGIRNNAFRRFLSVLETAYAAATSAANFY